MRPLLFYAVVRGAGDRADERTVGDTTRVGLRSPHPVEDGGVSNPAERLRRRLLVRRSRVNCTDSFHESPDTDRRIRAASERRSGEPLENHPRDFRSVADHGTPQCQLFSTCFSAIYGVVPHGLERRDTQFHLVCVASFE